MSDLHRKCKCGSGKKARWCCEKDAAIILEEPTMTKRSLTMNGAEHSRLIEIISMVPKGAKLKSCLECGLCCGLTQFDMSEAEWKALPQEWITKKDDGSYDMKRHPNGRCHLQCQTSNKCTIYHDPRKPRICTTFQRGSHPMCFDIPQNEPVEA